MIPGSTMSMENLMKYHTQKQLRTSYEEIFSHPYVVEKMKKIGLSIDPSLSDLEKHYCIINELRGEFADKYEFAKDKTECIKNKITEYKSYYEKEINHKIRGAVRNDLPVTDDDIKWPPSYVSYHCKQEGFNAKLSSLHIVLLYQLGFAKNIILSNLEPLLKDLAKGVAVANFIDELKKQLPENETSYAITKTLDSAPNFTNPINAKVESVAHSFICFELNARYSNLKKFKQGLEQRGYINKDFPIEVFRRVFLCTDDSLKDKLIRQPVEPIVWIANKSHLGYLIKQLSKNNIITEKDYYKIAENCFLFEGSPILHKVFHGMQLPAVNAKRKLDQICSLLT